MARQGRADQAIEVNGHVITLTNSSKVLFDNGVTKRELAEYYLAAAEAMLPHMRERPVVMMRYPDGINGQRIVQKNIPDYFPDWVGRVAVPRREGGSVCHVVCRDAATLVYLANQACIEPHVFLSSASSLDRPHELVFDLDPASGQSAREQFATARRAALWLRDLLESELGLTAFAKTTGGHGVHVHVPLNGRAEFEAVRDLARGVAEVLATRHPEDLTMTQRVASRGHRVYLDIMRNAYAQTVIAAYGVRGRPGAPVATPLTWAELEDAGVSPGRFTLRSAAARLEQVAAGSDPWADYGRQRASVPAAVKKVGHLATG